MKPGDIIFSKKFKTSLARKAPEIEVRGHAFSLMLGHVPPFAKEPPLAHIGRLLGTVGFMSFDDVADFLGDEQAALCVQKFEEKYWKGSENPVVNPQAEEVPPQVDQKIAMPEPAQIVGLDGRPLEN